MDHGASTLRIPPNRSGRDFVAGDVHGCFRTLEHALAKVHFDPSRDRLFSVGDLINRGPHSMEAVDWLTDGRIHAAVLGNHESTMLEHLRRGQDSVYEEWQRWIPDEEFPRWATALENMPIAITVETKWGDVGLVHAGPVSRSWPATLAGIEREDLGVISTALFGGYEGAGAAWRGPAGAPVEGVRAVVTGHLPRKHVEHDGTWWCIDTGAGMKQHGRLSLLRIDCEPMVPVTVHVVSEERQGSNHGRTHQ